MKVDNYRIHRFSVGDTALIAAVASLGSQPQRAVVGLEVDGDFALGHERDMMEAARDYGGDARTVIYGELAALPCLALDACKAVDDEVFLKEDWGAGVWA